MLKDEIRTGTQVEIKMVELTPAQMVGTAPASLSAKVIHVNTDDTVDLSIPVLDEEKVDLERNVRYSFLFVHNRTGIRTAQGVFLQRIRIDNVPMAKIKLVTPLKKIQRRDYFRITCSLVTSFQILSMRASDFLLADYMTKVSESIEEDKWRSGQILDISGGGLKFVTETPIIDFPYIYFTFELDYELSKKLVGITGRVLSRQPVPRTLLCTHRVKFEPEHSKAQDHILAYVYEKQREIAQSGRILETNLTGKHV